MNDVAEEIGGSRLLVETKGEKKTREKILGYPMCMLYLNAMY